MPECLLLAVVLAVAAVLAAAALRCDTVRAERAIWIHAPANRICPLIGDFHRRATGSPWEKHDPALTRHSSGAACGNGAACAREGDKEAPRGRREIRQAAAPSQDVIEPGFPPPFAAHIRAALTPQPAAGGSELRWALCGPQPCLFKRMNLLFDRVTRAGRVFETGLASIKAIAEQ